LVAGGGHHHAGGVDLRLGHVVDDASLGRRRGLG
jgi:hypothetical protein